MKGILFIQFVQLYKSEAKIPPPLCGALKSSPVSTGGAVAVVTSPFFSLKDAFNRPFKGKDPWDWHSLQQINLLEFV